MSVVHCTTTVMSPFPSKYNLCTLGAQARVLVNFYEYSTVIFHTFAHQLADPNTTIVVV